LFIPYFFRPPYLQEVFVDSEELDVVDLESGVQGPSPNTSQHFILGNAALNAYSIVGQDLSETWMGLDGEDSVRGVGIGRYLNFDFTIYSGRGKFKPLPPKS
jgi:hypothetical protein